MKKAMVFSLALVLLMLCVSATAESERTSGLFTYRLKGNGEAVITDFDWSNNNGQDIYVPRLIDGYTVTEIGSAAFSSDQVGYESNIKNSTYHKERVGVGDQVVVILPDTIKVIGEKAFFCSNITSVTIPASVRIIGAGAFSGCIYMKHHTVASGNSTFATIDGVLYNKAKKELISFPAGGYYSDFTIPEGITTIGDYSFYGVNIDAGNKGDRQIDTFHLASTIRTIGKYAFAFAMVRDIDLLNAKTIEEYGFANSYMRNVSLPSSLEILGTGVFMHSAIIGSGERITDLSQTNLKTIPAHAFQDCAVCNGRSIQLPSSLETIEPYAFSDVKYLLNDPGENPFVLPASVKTIGDNAFENYPFEQFSFEEGSCLKSIGTNAFRNTFKIESNGTIELPDGVESIGAYAFYSDNIKQLSIPSSVSTIGEAACNRNVTQLEVPSGSYAEFYASENGYGYVPSGGEDTSWLND